MFWNFDLPEALESLLETKAEGLHGNLHEMMGIPNDFLDPVLHWGIKQIRILSEK